MLKATAGRVAGGLALAALFLQALAMPAQAAGAISGGESSGSSCEGYYHQGVLAVAAAINAGDIETWSAVPGCGIARSNTQVLQWSGRMTGPVILGVVSVAGWTITGVSGCTVSAVTNLLDMGAAAMGESGTATFTMTSGECHAIATYTLSIAVAAVVVYQTRPQFSIDIRVEQPNMFYQCGANGLTESTFTPAGSQCLNPQVDNVNRLCAASTFGAACTTPTINAAITGTLTLGGAITATVSGTLDVLDRICAASPTGTTCTISNLNIHQDPICTAAAHCHVDTNSTLIGNSTTVFPGNLTVDLKSQGGLSSVGGPGFQWWTELVFWVLVFAFCWYFRSYYILVFAIGGVFHLINPAWVFGLDKSLPLIGLGFLLEWFVSVNRRRNDRLEPKGKGLSEAT